MKQMTAMMLESIHDLGRAGARRRSIRIGRRVGVAWIFHACGSCAYCREGRENRCADFIATGRDAHGGYAPFMAVDERFAYAIPDVETFTLQEANRALMELKNKTIRGAKVLVINPG